jgi:hypothetical protein
MNKNAAAATRERQDGNMVTEMGRKMEKLDD